MSAIFEKRENMGASPLAIEYTEHIIQDLIDQGIAIPRGTPWMLIAAMIDAAIRKSGAPELLTACRKMVAINESTAMDATEEDWQAVRLAIAKAEGRAQ